MTEYTILIIEDEPDMLRAIKLRLESIGFKVETASDGLEGLQKVKSIVPDLVLLDIMLPKMDGFKVCNMIKFDKKYKNIPVIILSAKSAQKDFHTAKTVGADAYLTKPFTTADMLKKIKELLPK
ncbi:MAG: two-component system response regulator [Candidatus Neomarinimicrobiota bacterium]|nr:response regulator [Candidatus Neomarinimicrobiota bacterium]RKY50201.1 MAG: two-component system response regulator [Candidatus Neomarinimicrobiota bacterium]